MNAGGSAITTPTTLAGALQLRDWTLDGVGNWASNDAQSVGDSLLTANRQHTNFNEIADVSGDVPPATFDNDDNGNLLTDDIYDYQWDALNRLRSVTRISDGLIIATSAYDCQNRRMRKVVTNSGSLDGTTDYYYAGWRVCEEYTLTGSSETLKYQYVWGATYHDELIARDDRQGGATVTQLNDGTGADRQFQHGNTLFSVFAVTDETGAVLERYQYDPYGNQTVMDASFNVLTDSAIDQEFSYTGQRFDAETDLYYYKNRYYSPDQGRFISRDPIGYSGTSLGLYEYVQSNSLNYEDFSGLIPNCMMTLLSKISGTKGDYSDCSCNIKDFSMVDDTIASGGTYGYGCLQVGKTVLKGGLCEFKIAQSYTVYELQIIHICKATYTLSCDCPCPAPDVESPGSIDLGKVENISEQHNVRIVTVVRPCNWNPCKIPGWVDYDS